MKINGIIVPDAVEKAMDEGVWHLPAERSILANYFPNTGMLQAYMYDWETMRRENDVWAKEADYRQYYVGTPSAEFPPGDINPEKSLFIGGLGPDEMIALDFRPENGPSVIYLSDQDPHPWRLVTPTVGEFVALLREWTAFDE